MASPAAQARARATRQRVRNQRPTPVIPVGATVAPATNRKEAAMAAKTETTTTSNPATEVLLQKLPAKDAAALMQELGYTFNGRATRQAQAAALQSGKIAMRQKLRTQLLDQLGLPSEKPAPAAPAAKANGKRRSPQDPAKLVKARSTAAAKAADVTPPKGAHVGRMWVLLADRAHGLYVTHVWVDGADLHMIRENGKHFAGAVANVCAAWPQQLADALEGPAGTKAATLVANVPDAKKADPAMGC